IIAIHDFLSYRSQVEMLPYSQFLSELDTRKIESVEVYPDRIEGKLKNPPQGHPGRFVTLKIDDPDLIQNLTDAKVKFEGVRKSTFLRDIMSWIAPAAVMIGLWWLVLSRMGKTQGQFLSLGKSKAKIFVERDLKIRFSDVAGVSEAKA